MALINSEIAVLKVNGAQQAIVDESFTWGLGGKERTAVTGSGRVLGFTEKTAPSTCEFSIAYTADFDPGSLDVTDAQIQVTTDQGETWVMTGASLIEPPQWSAGEGNWSFSYQGNKFRKASASA